MYSNFIWNILIYSSLILWNHLILWTLEFMDVKLYAMGGDIILLSSRSYGWAACLTWALCLSVTRDVRSANRRVVVLRCWRSRKVRSSRRRSNCTFNFSHASLCRVWRGKEALGITRNNNCLIYAKDIFCIFMWIQTVCQSLKQVCLR